MTSEPVFFGLAFVVAGLAGAVAAVSGFGIGSLLTPLLTWKFPTKLAVAAVSVPHFFATAFRLWLLRREIDRQLLWNFGLMSAAGGLFGALLSVLATSSSMTVLFGGLLTFTGIMGLTGLSDKLRFDGWAAWVAGFLSGTLGGFVGNQGGIRSAAMLGFDVPRQAFVATATAVGLIVDTARMPVYLTTQWRELLVLTPLLVTMSAGALVGTAIGGRLLKMIPQPIYRPLVSSLILCLGLYMLTRG